jgi:hypothetical protein
MMNAREQELITKRVQALEIDALEKRVTDALLSWIEWTKLHLNDDPFDLPQGVRRALNALAQALGLDTVDAVFEGMEPNFRHVLVAFTALHQRFLDASVIAEAEAALTAGDDDA